ncbi:MAG TPA: EamA family transporter [Oligoflexia bacterium]|nr:EamA family transporter [Oligoflexia bacterium]HMR23946.1 EamA family transporter [Oligoflexia bacterium]
MLYLFLVSCLWAFSFPLIKLYLVGIDSSLVAMLRLGISLLCFLPLISFSLNHKDKLKLIALGMIQYGLMYALYIQSYQYLKSYEVALFTITTPLWVILCGQLMHKRFSLQSWVIAGLACIGALVLVFNAQNTYSLSQGFILVQVANICFALGQVYYKYWWQRSSKKNPLKQSQIFAYLFFGATLINFMILVLNQKLNQISSISNTQWLILLYLGSIASGLGFYLWNYGATLVKHATLASFNNLKIPLTILTAIVVFQEQGNLIKLLLGTVCIIIAISFAETIKTKDFL